MEKLKKKLALISPYLNEKQRRIVYAAEANQIGRGGKSLICSLVNISRSTLNQGIKDLFSDTDELKSERIRKEGAGRKSRVESQPGLKEALVSCHSLNVG